MVKRMANAALFYAVTAMVFGVFYREFTKFSGYAGVTNLSFLHTHYFLLGMFFFLVLMMTAKQGLFVAERRTGVVLTLYHVGLNITGVGFLLRGLTQVLGTTLTRGMDAGISGIAGIGHILLGVSMIFLLLQIRKQAKA